MFPWYGGRLLPQLRRVRERCEPRGRHGHHQFQGQFVHDEYWNNRRVMDWMDYTLIIIIIIIIDGPDDTDTGGRYIYICILVA